MCFSGLWALGSELEARLQFERHQGCRRLSGRTMNAPERTTAAHLPLTGAANRTSGPMAMAHVHLPGWWQRRCQVVRPPARFGAVACRAVSRSVTRLWSSWAHGVGGGDVRAILATHLVTAPALVDGRRASSWEWHLPPISGFPAKWRWRQFPGPAPLNSEKSFG